MNRFVKDLLSIMALGVLQGTMAQEVITPLGENPQVRMLLQDIKAAPKAASADTLVLPFFEDFSDYQGFPHPDLWSDRFAFINNNYGVDPVSNGVATLDAVDEEGSIYANATFDPTTFEADVLSSLPIDLDYEPGDSLYFSFLYQPKGLGDEPELQDSLLLDFYRPSDSVWVNVWSIAGSPLRDFRQVMIPVKDPFFLEKGFRFRFRNLASLPRNNDYPDRRANVDHWNVDYVRLDQGRFLADTVLRDVAIVTPIGSILEDLSALPWEHFEDARLTALETLIPVRYRNNDTIARNITRTLLIEEVLWNESFSPGAPTAQDLPAGSDTVVEFPYFYPIDFERGDSAIIRFTASLRTDELDPKVNDTVVHDQVFTDYYAYDDGTAEAGYGLRGQGTRNGSVALQYFAYTPDQIGGVDISFNKLYDSINLGYFFKLIVWNDNAGLPGSILFEDGNDHTPAYTEQFPGFTRYHFTEPVDVDGAFYVGWRQYNEFMLNVGLDLNNRPMPHVMYYNYQGIWETSNAPGVIMIRPFLYDPTTHTPSRKTDAPAMHLFPNPAAERVHWKLPAGQEYSEYRVELYDISGRVIGQWHRYQPSLELPDLPSGIYYLRVGAGYNWYVSKLMINPR